jgi:hypothetical protein
MVAVMFEAAKYELSGDWIVQVHGSASCPDATGFLQDDRHIKPGHPRARHAAAAGGAFPAAAPMPG